MKFPIDSYEIKARYAPGLLLALPVMVTFWTCFQIEAQLIFDVFKGISSMVVWYILSVYVRYNGKRIEPKLWKSWGGAPSTVLVSWKDNRLGHNLKEKYHQMVIRDQGLPMPTKADEDAGPEKAAQLIDQAFSRVKGVIRKHDKNGLWFIADAEYGFARNLFGSRVVWLIISIVMTVISAGSLWQRFNNLILVGFIIDFLVIIGCVVFGWFILPKLTKQFGFRYAEHAWESFCNIAEERAKTQ